MSTPQIPSSSTFLPSLKNTRVRVATLWSSEDVRRLREMASDGMTLSAIAAALRRSESAIRNKATMHGISLAGRAGHSIG